MRRLPFGLGLALLWSPVVALLFLGRESLRWVPLSGRQSGLLAQSLGYSVSVGVLCSGIGFLLALRLWRSGAARRPVVQATLATLIALPATVVATSWMGVSGGFGRLWTQGWLPSILVQTLALLPLAVCVIALSLERLDGDALDAANVASPPSRRFWRVLVPLMRPALAAAASLTALLALGDFTVPSLFGANPYSLEIFAMFSAGEDAVSACWPLLALALPLAWVAGRWTSSLVSVRGTRPSTLATLPGSIEGLSRAATLVAMLAASSALLLLVLQTGSLSGSLAEAANARDELTASLRFAGTGALLALVIGLATAPVLAHRGGAAAWALVLAPVALPPALLGMGLARLAVSAGDSWWAGAIDPGLATAMRFAPFAAAVLALEWARLDPHVLDAGRTFARPVRRAARLWLPMTAGGLLAALALCFALGLGELGATLLVVPPGQSTLSIRLYNLLHYGASENVAALALLLAMLPLGVALLSSVVFARFMKGRAPWLAR